MSAEYPSIPPGHAVEDDQGTLVHPDHSSALQQAPDLDIDRWTLLDDQPAALADPASLSLVGNSLSRRRLLTLALGAAGGGALSLATSPRVGRQLWALCGVAPAQAASTSVQLLAAYGQGVSSVGAGKPTNDLVKTSGWQTFTFSSNNGSSAVVIAGSADGSQSVGIDDYAQVEIEGPNGYANTHEINSYTRPVGPLVITPPSDGTYRARILVWDKLGPKWGWSDIFVCVLSGSNLFDCSQRENWIQPGVQIPAESRLEVGPFMGVFWHNLLWEYNLDVLRVCRVYATDEHINVLATGPGPAYEIEIESGSGSVEITNEFEFTGKTATVDLLGTAGAYGAETATTPLGPRPGFFIGVETEKKATVTDLMEVQGKVKAGRIYFPAEPSFGAALGLLYLRSDAVDYVGELRNTGQITPAVAAAMLLALIAFFAF